MTLFVVTLTCAVLLLVASVIRLTGSGPGITEWFLLGVAMFSSCRWIFLLSLAGRARREHAQMSQQIGSAAPYVSVFVPSYNESQTIEAALDSLLQLDYPAYEVIVVNDGSSDDTLSKARRYEGRHGPCLIRVIDKPNGGKWSAHNTAFQASGGELILCIDADSQLDPSALKCLVARLADPQIAGVAGQMRVRNRVNLLTQLQGLEYLMANGAVRLAQGYCGSVLLVPGPIGLFRRSALEEVYRRYGCRAEESDAARPSGPFEGDTFAEDFDLSLAVHWLGGRIVYEPTAVSRTKAPAHHFGLVNQRYRWIRGTIQVLKKLFRRAREKPEMLAPRLGGWIVLTYVPDLLLMPLLYVVGLLLFGAQLVQGDNLLPLVGWLAAFLVVQSSAGAFFIVAHKDDLKLLKTLPLFGLYNGFVLNCVWWISVIDEVRGTRMRW